MKQTILISTDANLGNVTVQITARGIEIQVDPGIQKTVGPNDRTLSAQAHSKERPRIPARPSRRASVPMTDEIAAGMKWLLAGEPESQHNIAAIFGVNSARVSEVKFGKKYADVPAAPPVI